MTDNAREREDRRGLLEKAALLNERHRAKRGAGFNIFTVLRDKHEEADLHSAFLAALMDIRQPSGARANLEDFLKTFAPRGDFDLHGVKVEKERDHIDILISDSGYFGLYYDIGGEYAGCNLAAQVNGYEVYGEIVLGTQCAESKYRNTIYKIRDAMKGMHEDRKGKDGDEWLWIERLDPELLPENFRRDGTAFVEFLRDGERARELVHRIARELHLVWSMLCEGERLARSR